MIPASNIAVIPMVEDFHHTPPQEKYNTYGRQYKPPFHIGGMDGSLGKGRNFGI